MSLTGYQKSEFCFEQGRKMSNICLKQGQGMRGRAAPSHPGIYGVPPSPRALNFVIILFKLFIKVLCDRDVT